MQSTINSHISMTFIFIRTLPNGFSMEKRLWRYPIMQKTWSEPVS